MSSAFDTMQIALSWLEERLGEDEQAIEVIGYLREIVDDLHDYSHTHTDVLNRHLGMTPDYLRTVLRYDNPEERAMWLKRKR